MNLPAGYSTDQVIRLETNLDDLSPEIVGAVMDLLFAAGALDVWLTPIHMKKNRPAFMLSLLCEESHVAELTDIIFRETSAFGLRIEQQIRLKLERRFEPVETPFGVVTVKLGLKEERVVQVAPEFESCRNASQKSGAPIRAVYEAAVSAWRDANSP